MGSCDDQRNRRSARGVMRTLLIFFSGPVLPSQNLHVSSLRGSFVQLLPNLCGSVLDYSLKCLRAVRAGGVRSLPAPVRVFGPPAFLCLSNRVRRPAICLSSGNLPYWGEYSSFRCCAIAGLSPSSIATASGDDLHSARQALDDMKSRPC